MKVCVDFTIFFVSAKNLRLNTVKGANSEAVTKKIHTTCIIIKLSHPTYKVDFQVFVPKYSLKLVKILNFGFFTFLNMNSIMPKTLLRMV